MDDLNIERQEYEKSLEVVLAQMQKMLEQNQQLLEQNQQLAYNAAHPIRTQFNEMRENVGKAVKWCDARLDEIGARIDDFREKISDAMKKAGGKLSEVGGLAVTAVADGYQRAIDRLEEAKTRIKEFKDGLLSKLKALAMKPVEAFKDGISHIVEFTHNSMAKLDETISKIYSHNARGHEENAKRVANFEQAMHEAKQGLSNAVHALRGEPKVDVPLKPSKFLQKWQDKLMEDAKKDHEMSNKFDYKAAMQHIKADIQSDNREFKNFDDGTER